MVITIIKTRIIECQDQSKKELKVSVLIFILEMNEHIWICIVYG